MNVSRAARMTVVCVSLLGSLACGGNAISSLAENNPLNNRTDDLTVATTAPTATLPPTIAATPTPRLIDELPGEILGDYSSIILPEPMAFYESWKGSNADVAADYEDPAVEQELDRLGRMGSFYVDWFDDTCEAAQSYYSARIGVIQFRDPQAVIDVEAYYDTLRSTQVALINSYREDLPFANQARIEYHAYTETPSCNHPADNTVLITWQRANYLAQVALTGFSDHEVIKADAIGVAVYVDTLLVQAEQD